MFSKTMMSCRMLIYRACSVTEASDSFCVRLRIHQG